MKVIVCGRTPAGLTASAVLAREGHDVELVSSHESDEPEYLHGDLGVLERRGLFGDLPLEDLGALPLTRHQFFFSDGEQRLGFRSKCEGETPVLVRRRTLVEWLHDRVRETDVRDRTEAVVGSLIHRKDTVRGVWTDQGPLEGDVVYLAEGNFSWLTRQEGYHRTLPGENPDYLLNLSRTYSPTTGDGRRPEPGGADPGTPGTVTTFVLPPFSSNPSLNGVFRITEGTNQLHGSLMVPYEPFRERGTSVRELMDWAESLPVLGNRLTARDASSLRTSLRLPGGESRWATLRDHGLAVGGEGSGTSLLFPGVDSLGPPLHSAHQFARALSHLERSDREVSRESLSSHYVRPLKEGSAGRRSARSDPWVDFLLENDQGSLSRASSALVSGEIRSALTPGKLVETINALQPDSWTIPSIRSVSSFGQDLYRQISASFADDADPLNSSVEDVGPIRSLLVKLIRQGMIADTESSPSTESVRRLVSLLKLMGSVAGPSVAWEPDDGNTGSRSLEPRRQPVTGPGPSLLVAVGSSLSDDVEQYRRLDTACPADVFELDQASTQRDFTWSPERCTTCGICRFGQPRVDFTDDPPELSGRERSRKNVKNLLKSLYGHVPSHLPEELRGVLRRAHSRFRHARRTLRKQNFLTPDARRWIQGQLNLVRSEVRERAFPDGYREYARDYLALLDRVRRVLSREQYRFARKLLHQLENLYSPPARSMNSVSGSPSVKSTDADPAAREDGWLSTVVRNFTNEVEKRFHDRMGDPRRSSDDRGVALVLPGRNSELVSLGSPSVNELLVPQEKGFWTLSDRELKSLRSLRIADDLRFTRYELPASSSSPSPTLDYRNSTEPFLDLFLDLQEDLHRGLKALRSRATHGTERATGPDELLPLAYLEVSDACFEAIGESSHQNFEHRLFNLLAKQELLLGPDFGSLESMVHLRGQQDDNRELSPKASSLLELVVGSLGELSHEVLDRDLTSVEGVDPLGLSTEQRERWEEGDTAGIVDDAVRQWRTALGELRRFGDDENVTPEETGVFASRLRQTQQYLEHVLDRLRRGGSPRRETLLLDLAMRRVYRSRQPLGPVKKTPFQSAPKSKASPPENYSVKTTLDRLEGRFDDRATADEPVPGSRLYRSLIQFLGSGSVSSPTSSIRRVIVLLVEADRLMTVLGTGQESTNTFLLGRLLRVHGHLGRFLSSGMSFGDGSLRDSPANLWRETSRQLREQFTEGIYQDSFRRRIRGLTNQFRGEVPVPSGFFGEETDRESLERALELFSPPRSRRLQNRTNLHSLYVQYVLLIAELLRQEKKSDAEEGDSPQEEWIQEELTRRSQNVLRSTSSLLIHGTRDLMDEIEPPEAQVLDLLEPESIFARRYRSIG